MKNILILSLVSIFFIGCTGTNTPTLNPDCVLKPDPGMCRAYIPKYYFDQNDNKCKEFIWGGCKGTVPFDTINECKNSCDKN